MLDLLLHKTPPLYPGVSSYSGTTTSSTLTAMNYGDGQKFKVSWNPFFYFVKYKVSVFFVLSKRMTECFELIKSDFWRFVD